MLHWVPPNQQFWLIVFWTWAKSAQDVKGCRNSIILGQWGCSVFTKQSFYFWNCGRNCANVPSFVMFTCLTQYSWWNPPFGILRSWVCRYNVEAHFTWKNNRTSRSLIFRINGEVLQTLLKMSQVLDIFRKVQESVRIFRFPKVSQSSTKITVQTHVIPETTKMLKNHQHPLVLKAFATFEDSMVNSPHKR